MNDEALIKKRTRVFFILLLFLRLAAFLVSNGLGSMKISPERILQVLWDDDDSPQRLVVWNIRLPRTITAALVGINLALAGAILQGVMANPLADPGIIGISARSWPHVRTILPYTIAGVIFSLAMTEKLNILTLGDDIARGLGINVEGVRLLMTAVASLLAASAVSVVGLLGFVGLIIPHSARLITGTNYKNVFPCSILLGAAVVMLCDTFARTVFSPVEIPVGIVMAVLGAPFFLYLLRRA